MCQPRSPVRWLVATWSLSPASEAPGGFFRSLEALGCRLQAQYVFPDHHPFTAREIERIRAQAQDFHALAVTTAKDSVRLSPETRAGITVLSVDLEWTDGAALDDLLDRVGSAS